MTDATPEKTIDAPPPQMVFSLDNPGAPSTIYVSADPTQNKLSLDLSCTIDAQLSHATLVPFEQGGAEPGTLIYLDLSPLNLDAALFDTLSLEASGWESKAYSADNMIALTPTAMTAMKANVALAFALENFALATAPGASASLQLYAFNVPGVADGDLPASTSKTVAFVAPPAGHGDLRKVLSATVTPGAVVSSASGYPEVANKLSLTLAQIGGAPTATTGDNSVFTLSVAYSEDAEGFGALMTAKEGKAISIPVPQGSGWHTVDVDGTSGRSWQLTPPKNQALPTAGGNPVEFDITPIVTYFQPGATTLVLSYSGVPGFDDGTFPITVLKRPHVALSGVAVAPQISTLDSDGNAAVTLTWTASNATKVTLFPGQVDVTGLTSFPTSIADTQIFTLNGEGERPGNVDNTAIANVTATVLPVIDSFTASPPALYAGDFGSGYRTVLAWNVNTNRDVVVTSSVTGPHGPFMAAQQEPFFLSGPQLLTVAPKTGKADPKVSRSLVVSPFVVTAQQVPTAGGTAFAAAPASAPFIAMTSGAGVALLSTATYKTLSTVSAGSSPQGIAFSADGATMFVANSGDGTVGVYSVATSQTAPGFTVTATGTVRVGGAPQSVAAAGDGTVYVSIDKGGTAAGSVAILARSGGSYSVSQTVTVGIAPRGLALLPNGAALFVANQGGGSVSLVTPGSPASVSTPITGLKGPSDVAVSPDGKALLVSSAGDNAVFLYNAVYPSTSSRRALTVPGAGRIGMIPGGAYAIVTGTGPNQAVLINYVLGTISAATPLSGPSSGVAVTPDGGLAVVAGSGTILTLAQYAQVAATTPAGGQITNVAVSADNQAVIGWFNAALEFSGPNAGTPLTGFVKGPASGASLTPYLAGTQVYAAAVSPVAADDALYAGTGRGNGINVYKLSSMASLATVPIPPHPRGGARAVVGLGVSADGSALFALTDDGANQFSMVVVSASPSTGTFTPVADVVVYTSSEGQLFTPMGVAPGGQGSFSAFAVDTIANQLWTVSQVGGTYQAGSQPVNLGPASASVTGFAVSPDGGRAYASLADSFTSYVTAVDLASKTATTVQMPDSTVAMNITALQTSVDGRRLFACDSTAVGIRVLDSASLRIIQTLQWQNGVQYPFGIAAASDGSALFSANLQSKNIAIAQQVSQA
ncbi:MAG TPA: YncE family protein [Allosphingosinicella sp.]